jgi:hypothetical protein
MPSLPTASQTSNSIQIGSNTSSLLAEDADELALLASGGKWEDEEERRFFEDIQDLREVVPKSILGVEEGKEVKEENAEEKQKAEAEEVRKLEEELAGLSVEGATVNGANHASDDYESDDDDGYVREYLILTLRLIILSVWLHQSHLHRKKPLQLAHPLLHLKVHLNYSRRCWPVFQTAQTAR